MNNPTNLPGNPLAEREERIKFLQTWLETQPTTLALFRPPILNDDQNLGIFKSLGVTALVAIEQDGGLRDGHEYWHHSRSWSIHLRWYGLHWIFLHLQRRFDDQGIREILEHGTVIFDKVSLAPALNALARKAIIYKRVSARELYHFRIELGMAFIDLDDLYASTGIIDRDHLSRLFEIYYKILKIVDRLTTKSEDETKKELSKRLAVAGRGRQDFSSSILLLREVAERLLNKLGGKPIREFYAPAGSIYCMPPDSKGKQKELGETDIHEEFLCTTCGRLFALPHEEGHPILTHCPDSSIVRFSPPDK